ncbi:MAG: hypothetical protein GC138_00825 [Gammaproteobacteria bacterium]|nr:hypothetical protein [Gammaproteobacteria bacterium]
MIRYTLLTIFCTFVVIYLWRDWYKSLCGFMVLLSISESREMPKAIFGITGLNPVNLLLFLIVIAWWLNRRREGGRWDMSSKMTWLLVFYVGVIVVSGARLLLDHSGVVGFDDYFFSGGQGAIQDSSALTFGLFVDNFINTLKYLVPGVLLFTCARSDGRKRLAAVSLLLMYFILALQVIKWMPLHYILNGAELSERAARVLGREIGYFRTDLSTMLAGAGWAGLIALFLVKGKMLRPMVGIGSVMMMFAQALTGGRAGYAAWIVTGMVLSFARWKKFLVILPIMALVIVFLVPSVYQRALEGMNEPEQSVVDSPDETIDTYALSAGRLEIWPYVVDKILDRPFVGYGSMGMQNSGLSTFLAVELKEPFPHPHNAYLRLLIDAGVIGAVPIFYMFILFLKMSYRLFKSGGDKVSVSIGGMTLAMIISQLVAGVGSQNFFPTEGTFGMWAFIGMMSRCYIDRFGKRAM